MHIPPQGRKVVNDKRDSGELHCRLSASSSADKTLRTAGGIGSEHGFTVSPADDAFSLVVVEKLT